MNKGYMFYTHYGHSRSHNTEDIPNTHTHQQMKSNHNECQGNLLNNSSSTTKSTKGSHNLSTHSLIYTIYRGICRASIQNYVHNSLRDRNSDNCLLLRLVQTGN